MGKAKEPYPGFRQEARAFAQRAQAMRDASAEPLPGPLQEAFAAAPAEVAGLRVRPLVHYDFVILRRLDSPLLKQLAAAADATRKPKRRKPDPSGTTWSDEQGYEMIYQFTRPAEEVVAFFARHGAAAPVRFRETALREIGLKLGPLEVAALIPEVVRVFLEAFSTRVRFEPKETGDAGFQSPPAEPTASAGGSTTSAASPPSTPH